MPELTSHTLQTPSHSLSNHLHFGDSSPRVCGLNREVFPRARLSVTALQLTPEQGWPKSCLWGDEAGNVKRPWFLWHSAAWPVHIALVVVSFPTAKERRNQRNSIFKSPGFGTSALENKNKMPQGPTAKGLRTASGLSLWEWSTGFVFFFF